MTTLLVAAGIHTLSGDPNAEPARALLLDGNRIAWVGAVEAAPAAGRTVDLADGWVTPAFVDAHVHATATGLALEGVALATASSAAEVLDRLRDHAAGSDSAVILGYGWDDFGWVEGGPPTAEQISRAAPGRTVLLTRVDAHSCLVDAATLTLLPLQTLEGVVRDEQGTPTGWLQEAASEAALAEVRQRVPSPQLRVARTAACRAAASLGIASLHEMGHPGLWGLDDARAWAVGDWPIEVHTWWAQLDLAAATDNGLRPGGDLFLDGSIGSATAATSAAYGPDGGNGTLFHGDEAVAAWFDDCTSAGRGGGVHAIGDRAIEQAISAVEAAAVAHGADAVRRCRHRIEHVELPTRRHVNRMARLGIVASVQPAFDATWGGDDGLYAARFGTEVARSSNPLAWFAREGVVMAFGSDSTVTPLDPWGGVAAATHHRGGLGLPRSTALSAHTLGGRYVAGQGDVGALVAGQRADFAVWDADPLATEDLTVVRCLATVVAGTVAHGDLTLDGSRAGRTADGFFASP
ncbi:MAG: amidohydrolase family protein [Actinomycetota bacterium]|nr:amidohydrolase family protein [Actinomycetota bacterium]